MQSWGAASRAVQIPDAIAKRIDQGTGAAMTEGLGGVSVTPASVTPAAKPNAKAQEMMAYTQSQFGYSKSQSASLIAQAQKESSLNTTAEDSTGHKGLFQWDQSRFAQLQAYATSIGGDWKDWKVQLQFANQEIQKMVPGFKNLHDTASQTAALTTGFEKSKNQPQDISKRTAQANANLGFDYTATKKSMDEELKVLQNTVAKEQATYNLRIAQAGSDKQKADQIDKERIEAMKKNAAEEEAIRQKYAAKTTDPEQKKLLLEGTNQAQVKAIQAQTQEERANQTIITDQLRVEKNKLEAQLAQAATVKQQYAIKVQIAHIDAQLANDDIEGASIEEKETAEAEKQLKAAEQTARVKQANAQQRSIESGLKSSTDKLDTQVDLGQISKMDELKQEMQLVTQAGQQEAAVWQQVANAAQAGSQAQIDAQEKVAEVTQQTADKISEVQKKIAEEAKKEADEFAKPFTQAFDEIGQGLKGALDDEIKGMIDGFGKGTQQIQYFQTTAANGLPIVGERIKTISAQTEILRKVEESAAKALLNLVMSMAEKGLASGLGKLMGGGTDTSGGLSGVLGQGVGKLFGMGAGSIANNATNAATTTAPITGAISAQTGTLTGLFGTLNAATTTGDASIVTAVTTSAAASSATGAVGSAASLGGSGLSALGGGGASSAAISAIGMLPFFNFGGVVPSAAGGMIVPGSGGGQLSILHPQEMVLPAHISKGIQDKINMPSANFGNEEGNNNQSGDTHFHIHAIDTQSGADFLMKHAPTILKAASKASRSNTLSMRTF
jgi:hypothetical protein